MGTNYYVAKNKCSCCNRYDREYHIGKSSFGWAFSFRGYRSERLVSWQAWRQFLENNMIVDEYGDFIDYAEFCHMIENEKAPGYVRSDGRRNLQHNEEGRKRDGEHRWPWFNPEYDWDDPEGYSFSSREFS